jgi:hypothetical protein
LQTNSTAESVISAPASGRLFFRLKKQRFSLSSKPKKCLRRVGDAGSPGSRLAAARRRCE